MKKDYTYVITTPNEENPMEAVIEKGNLTVSFTPNQVMANMSSLGKTKQELEGKLKIEEAKMANILRDMPQIADMSEELRGIVYIYTQAYSTAKVAREKLAEVDEALNELHNEVIDIVMQTGLNIPIATKPADEKNG